MEFQIFTVHKMLFGAAYVSLLTGKNSLHNKKGALYVSIRLPVFLRLALVARFPELGTSCMLLLPVLIGSLRC